MKSHRLPYAVFLSALAVSFGLVSQLSAQSWNQTAAGTTYDWNNSGNWTATFPNAAGATANVNNNIAGNQTIRFNQAITVGILNLGDSDGSNAFTLSTGTAGSLTFDSGVNGTPAQINLSSSLLVTNTISAPITLSSNLVVDMAGTDTANNQGITLSGTVTMGTKGITFKNGIYNGGAGNLGTGQTLSLTSGGFIFAVTGGGVGVAGAGAAAGTLNFVAEGVVWTNGTQTNSIGAVISGSNGFTKAGTGTLPITGNNSYSGLTYVSSGTLIVGDGTNASHLGTTGNVKVANGAILSLMNNATIADTASLTLESFGLLNGKLTLASGVNETVGSLLFGTQSQAAGTWGATGSGATNINDTYFTGLGMLTVVPEPATWALLAGAGTFLMVMCRRRE